MDYREILFCLFVLLAFYCGRSRNSFIGYHWRTRINVPQNVHPQVKYPQMNHFMPLTINHSVPKKMEAISEKSPVLKEGSTCRRSFDGKMGSCVLATDCLHVIREFRKTRAKLDICTYRRKVAVICCPPPEKNESILLPKRISVKKCEKYLNFKASFRYKRNSTDPIPKCYPSNPLVVGGEPTYTGEFPHMVAVGWSQYRVSVKWACGGSLINEHYVLTAAHCTMLKGFPPDIVRLGKKNLFAKDEKGDPQDIEVADIIKHPSYNLSTYYHDIALLKLAKKPNFSRFVRPACLWQFPDINTKFGIATGWGRFAFNGPQSDELQKVELPLAENNLCTSLYKNVVKLPNGITDNQFCAGYLKGGKDTCLGDSGGPIHITVPEGKCVNYIIGVTSFGKICAEPNSLGVYTKVYSYLDWIEEVAFNEV